MSFWQMLRDGNDLLHTHLTTGANAESEEANSDAAHPAPSLA